MDITRTQNSKKETLPGEDRQEELELYNEAERNVNVTQVNDSFHLKGSFNAATLCQREVLNTFDEGKKSPSIQAQQKLWMHRPLPYGFNNLSEGLAPVLTLCIELNLYPS